ncbi:type VII secretion integral membrane protein EccD [Streptomyces sp. NBC_01429]|uniref:type VII secretion integral membrane protein EccD n=1 Tax=Streptomyces sp. NBC_01429 TaxID=2903862 RepID=UPI002E2C3E11|nr:type VII secretion integral membrane protein EccD [Streptomyces sp. NBC_01429]
MSGTEASRVPLADDERHPDVRARIRRPERPPGGSGARPKAPGTAALGDTALYDAAPANTAPGNFCDTVPGNTAPGNLRDTAPGRPAARVMAGLTTVSMAVAVALLARGEFAPEALGAALPVAALPLAAGGVAAGRSGRRGLAATLLLTGGALGTLGAWALADAHHWPGTTRAGAVACAVTLTLALLGRFVVAGRGVLAGAGALAVTTLGWEAVAALLGGAQSAPSQAGLGTVLAVASVLGLGALPRLALMGAGLTRLDDRRSAGASVSRHQVAVALTATHRRLLPATVVLAVSATAAGLLVVRAPDGWTVTTAVVLAVLLPLRARAFPPTAQASAVRAAGLVLALRLTALWLEHTSGAWPLLLPLALAAAPLLGFGGESGERLRARLRRTGDAAEYAGVIALLAAAAGVFGVHGLLPGSF